MRHCATRLSLRKMPIWVCVLPVSMASNMGRLGLLRSQGVRVRGATPPKSLRVPGLLPRKNYRRPLSYAAGRPALAPLGSAVCPASVIGRLAPSTRTTLGVWERASSSSISA